MKDSPASSASFRPVRKAEFLVSAAGPSQWPETGLPEIAFAGRSNVGKSSLINALVGRRKLVKTSGTPGKTRLINFFNVDDAWVLVDLPGYGYARVSKIERARWGRNIEAYLRERRPLAAVALLLDCRRIPSDDDRLMADFLLKSNRLMIPVLTKIDKLSGNERVGMRRTILEAMAFGLEPSMVVEFSAVTGQGREALWQRLSAVAPGD